MQQKNFTEETLITNQHIPGLKSANYPPLITLLYPGDDTFLPMQCFRRLATCPGVSYIVIKCGPASEAGLTAALQEFTNIPVLEAENGMTIDPDHVYVVSPEMSVQQSGDQLQFRTTSPDAQVDGAIELLLASVAAVAPDQHIVLLTKNMAGRLSAALRTIKDQGGFSITLTDDTPFIYGHTSVTASDIVLPVTEAIVKAQMLIARLKKPDPLTLGNETEKTALAHIYIQLMQTYGIDFSRLRQKEVLHRIDRRMIIRDITTIHDYASLLDEDGEEMIRLFQDLKISSAGFFLDTDTEYALLNDILPGVLSHHQEATPLRIWIPCCTGGQMAYSLAIFLSEYLRERKLQVPVQVFATDLNKAAMELARIGAYQAAELAGMPAAKRKRYFTRLPDGGHQVNRAIREMCVFATHNLQKDPPFSHVDILIATSTMVGLSQGSLDRIYRSFHYALSPHGYLFLSDGDGDGSGGLAQCKNYPPELFRLLRNAPCILTRNDVPGKFESFLPIQPLRKLGEQEAGDVLLSGYVPPTLLVDEQLRIVRFYGHTEPYLRLSQDRLSLHLLRIVRDELVFELDELIQRSVTEGKTVIKENIRIGSGENSRPLSIEVTPLRNFGSKWKLIIIREMEAPKPLPANPKTSGRPLTSKDIRILALEKEVNELHALLIAANRESASTQEALQRFNEDILASNEEFKSVNEQLHSVNRQLLSYNVELNTVNEDLHLSNRELELSVEYAHAIVSSIRQPLVVLHDDLRVHLANPSFCYFFGLSEPDTQGQSLFTIAGGVLDRDEFKKNIRQALAKKINAIDLELRIDLPGRGERILAISLCRMHYVKNIRTGLILSLEDITERTMTERFKDEFIGIASHELKTPATTIQAYSQLLYEELTATRDPLSAELVKKLGNQAARLT
ncbi:MAG TPA: CheR family methyltransferase, partial [Puia sp.]|nr:CheR family methyltransferase [Puia sp.]